MQVGDLVKFFTDVGIIICVDPEEIGDNDEVEVHFADGTRCHHSTCTLEVISASR